MNESADRCPRSLVTLDAGLEREFEERLRESARLAFRVAFGVVRQRQDAEDVAQEAFAKAYRSFAQLRDRERFRAWLVRMTWRLAIDRLRMDQRRSLREEAALTLAPPPTSEEAALSEERAAALWRAIDTLPERLRIVIVLSAIEGHDVREVARLLALPEGTIKSRLFTARKKLMEGLRCLANDSTTA
ncbi:MAG: RNA polymerase sigma factor [Chloroflexota bacterium]